MEAIINHKDIKNLLKETLIEMLQEKQKELIEIFREAIEDVGLANAIADGRKGDIIPKTEIMDILDN